ncbi:MAG TPA: nitroreductase/quinone reductase family protein [Candidatus Limnocylindria bacterium]|nr:nitroreductase/quinone reductase family protein [Candidatus Limnocylindria bacterium]
MESRRSAAWTVYLRWQYRALRVLDPLLRVWWRTFGIGITVDLEVSGRRTGRTRRVLVGLLRVDGRWYVGHPNGPVQWTKNLAAAGRGRLTVRGQRIDVTARRLGHGAERAAAIVATASQQPFPANLVYRAARRHVLAVGDYFRLEPMD